MRMITVTALKPQAYGDAWFPVGSVFDVTPIQAAVRSRQGLIKFGGIPRAPEPIAPVVETPLRRRGRYRRRDLVADQLSDE